MANINVAVTIDTVNITSSNLSTSVVLTDDNGDKDDTPGNSTTFDIHAAAGQTVAFHIFTQDGTTQVSFVSFQQESGVAAFSELPSSSNNWTGTVSSSVTGSEQFSITFNVAGKTGSPFTLDPELKVNQ